LNLSKIIEMRIELNRKSKSIKVISLGTIVLDFDDFPVEELIHQIEAWLSEVTEEKAKVFIYKSHSRELHGTFQIEARPTGWQFTSWKEKRRSPEILTLEQWRAILKKAMVEST